FLRMAPSDPPISSVAPQQLSPSPTVGVTSESVPLKKPFFPSGVESRSPELRPSRTFLAVLAVLVLAFAFLASSTAVRNSAFWRHRAAARLLAQGTCRFGVDPFTYTNGGEYWVNHAWLFDLGLYAAYEALGGAGLVVLKALVITLLAWRLLQIRRPGSSVVVPAACTLLALLVMSPQLVLQPVCVSLLLLGL